MLKRFAQRVPLPNSMPTSWRASTFAAFLFTAFCLFVQAFSGSRSAGFLAYPDEPSHFVGAVMIRDWILSGHWAAPLEFARNYYEHYPFFAVGYWPPLFSFVTGLWMLVAGVGRLQALLIPALFAAATAWLIFRLVVPRAGTMIGLCAGMLYLSLPQVRQWMCAVMVDTMTAFLCLAVAASVLLYLKRPVFWNGVLCGLCCGFAILSKYSAAYTIALPIASVILLRRFALLKKPSLLIQPVLVMLMVAPWAVWTRRLAFYGLPGEREALTVKRAASFLLATVQVFPPVLMVAVIVGLLALLFRPSIWREDVVVMSLLCVAHLAFMIVSPVGPEQRYLLAPAAALLVASFAGWSGLLASSAPAGQGRVAALTAAAVLTVGFVAWQLANSVRMLPDPIRSAVASITADAARVGQRIVVSPMLEGPMIAEFVAQSRNRPEHYLLRPSKLLAHTDWFGGSYSCTFTTSEAMMEFFRSHPANLIVWNDRQDAAGQEHVRIMGEMLRNYPPWWHRIRSIGAPDDPAWSIYEYEIPPENLK